MWFFSRQEASCGLGVQKWNDTQQKTVESGYANPLTAMILNKTCPNYSKLDAQLVLSRSYFLLKHSSQAIISLKWVFFFPFPKTLSSSYNAAVQHTWWLLHMSQVVWNYFHYTYVRFNSALPRICSLTLKSFQQQIPNKGWQIFAFSVYKYGIQTYQIWIVLQSKLPCLLINVMIQI